MDFIFTKLKNKNLYRNLVFIIVGFFILYYSGLNEERYYNQLKLDGAEDVFDAFYLLYIALTIGFFSFYILIVAGSSYSYVYLQEKNNGIGNLLISRSTFFKYFMSKIIKTLISTVLIVVLSILLYFSYVYYKWGINTFDYSAIGANEWVYTNKVPWLFVQITTYSLFAGIFSLLNIGISRYIKRYQLLFLFPFVTYMIVLLILSIINSLSWRIGFDFQWAFIFFPLNLTQLLLDSMKSNVITTYIFGLIFYTSIVLFLLISTYLHEKRNYIAR